MKSGLQTFPFITTLRTLLLLVRLAFMTTSTASDSVRIFAFLVPVFNVYER